MLLIILPILYVINNPSNPLCYQKSLQSSMLLLITTYINCSQMLLVIWVLNLIKLVPWILSVYITDIISPTPQLYWNSICLGYPLDCWFNTPYPSPLPHLQIVIMDKIFNLSLISTHSSNLTHIYNITISKAKGGGALQ